MKVNIKANFILNEPDYETKSQTLDELCEELTRKYKNQPDVLEFYDELHHDVFEDCEILVNKIPYSKLEHGLKTQLHDGDNIEIYFFLLAGG